MIATAPSATNTRLDLTGPSLLQRCLALLLASLALAVCGLSSQRIEAQQHEPSATATAATAAVNGALIKGAYAAFARGDIDGAMAAFADDIVWHVPGRGPLSRDYHGRGEVLGFFGHFMELSAGTFRLQVDDVMAQGDRVVVLCTESAQRGSRAWSSPQVHVWTVKDGKAIAFWEYPGDTQTEDEFWSSPG
jgi:uncharacterized protein